MRMLSRLSSCCSDPRFRDAQAFAHRASPGLLVTTLPHGSVETEPMCDARSAAGFTCQVEVPWGENRPPMARSTCSADAYDWIVDTWRLKPELLQHDHPRPPLLLPSSLSLPQRHPL